MGGKDASGNYNAGSVWQMKNGEWHAIFHTTLKARSASEARREIGNACLGRAERSHASVAITVQPASIEPS